MNVERVKKLQGLYEDLRTGGLKEDGPEKKGKENAGREGAVQGRPHPVPAFGGDMRFRRVYHRS